MNKLVYLMFFLNLALAQLDDFPCEDEELAYVCGADGRTYKNQCYLDLLRIELAYPGKCVNCEYCTGIQELVCGNDGKTYTNSCWADCNGAYVVRSGPCADQCNHCPAEIAPVCGKNGKTYRNFCYADCDKTIVSHHG